MNEYWSYKIASWLVRVLPTKSAYWLGLRIADRFYWKNPVARAAVRSNIKRIFEARGIIPTEQTLDGMARKTYQYFGKYLVDFFRYTQLTREEVAQQISFEHLEYLDQALSLGRGVLLVTAHFGNWELAGAVMAALGHPISAVVLPQRLERLNSMFQLQRQRRGIKPIPIGPAAAFSIIRRLRRKELVAVLGDRDFTSKDDRVPFFGAPARIPRGPAWLSFKTGAPILPGFLIRQVDDTFLMRAYPPIIPEQEGSVEAIRSKISRILEKEIGEQPFQWFIFDDFWADRSGSPSEEPLA